ncbi:hypothetical protein F5888DRAFT_800475 [Russula emetica]|nr:hypothetical protein F5888DRAFT_800475 [Russula emetica]
MFASSSRLDLNIIVGPEKPGHIKTILSGHLPILIDYLRLHGPLQEITGSALWRMRAALRHRDRVREISFRGWHVFSIGNFIRATNYHFPALESLILIFPYGHEPDIPPTFLRGPDQSDLPLRRLTLYGASLASVSGLLLSATALTDLTLTVSSNVAVFDSSQGSFLLACLQGMQCLRSLDLTTPYDRRDSRSQHLTPKNIVPLLKLTRFHYSGPTMLLNNFMSGLSAPSLQDVRFVLYNKSPLLYLSRVIDDLREEFRSVSVTFDSDVECFRLLSSTHSGKIDHFKPSFRFNVDCCQDSIKSINSTPSMKLAMAEELALNFPSSDTTEWEHDFSLREFLRQFRSVRVLRVNPFIWEVALSLQKDDGETLLPLLEEIELSTPPISRSTKGPDEEYERCAAAELAAFEPFVSAREQTGCLVNVVHREMHDPIEESFECVLEAMVH